jgi:hypothetical protein
LNRNRVIAGILISILIALFIASAWWLVRSLNPSGRAGHKTFVARLGYCGAEAIGPCILSFSQAGDGKMQVDVLVPSSVFPDFYLTISREGQQYRYECEESEDSPTHIHCVGAEMFPGELLQFSLVAMKDERVLAEGQFAIIGLLLSTPIGGAFEPMPPTEPPSGTPTLVFPEITPVVRTPIPTATLPSYPNPTSYPNPSYRNP